MKTHLLITLLVVTFSLQVSSQTASLTGFFHAGVTRQEIGNGKTFLLENYKYRWLSEADKPDSILIINDLIRFLNNNPDIHAVIQNYEAPSRGQVCGSITSRTSKLEKNLIESGIASRRVITFTSSGSNFTVPEDNKYFKKGTILNAEFMSRLTNNKAYIFASQLMHYSDIRLFVPAPETIDRTDFTDAKTGESKPLILRSIYFSPTGWELMPQSKPQLDALLDFLRTNENMLIEISSHFAPPHSPAYSVSSDQKRAQSVVDYLTENGINPSRHIAKGYGKTSPYTIDGNEHSFFYFGEKGTVLTDSFCLAVNDKTFRIVTDDLNRRIEIRIVNPAQPFNLLPKTKN